MWDWPIRILPFHTETNLIGGPLNMQRPGERSSRDDKRISMPNPMPRVSFVALQKGDTHSANEAYLRTNQEPAKKCTIQFIHNRRNLRIRA